MPNPTVSVVIPCYNAHHFLTKALDSVRAQSFRDFEIIVVDDGSTDPDTRTYLDSLSGDVRIIRQANRGLPGARNRGFREARGKYVLPLDCDDWIEPDYLQKTVTALKHSDRVDFAFTYITLFGEEHGVLIKSFNLFEQLFFNQLPYCMLIPRSAWEQVGGYDESMRSGYEDWDFNIRLALAGYRGIEVSEPLFHYRVSKTGMLGSLSRRRHAQLWRVIRAKHLEIYRGNALIDLWRKWRAFPSTHLLIIYFAWNLLEAILPALAINAVLRVARIWSHSRQISRASDARRIVEATISTPMPSPHGAFFSVFLALFSRLSGYLVLILCAWKLAPDEFGILAALMVVGGIVNALVGGGGDMWLNRFTTPQMAQHGRAPPIWLLYLTISAGLLVLSNLLSAAASAFIPVIAQYGATISVAVLAFSVGGLSEAMLALMRASGRVTLFFLIRDLGAPLAILAGIYFSRFETAEEVFIIYAVTWCLVCASLLLAGGSLFRTALPPPIMRRILWLPTLRHTARLVISNLSSRLAYNIDTLVLTMFVSLTALGEYRVAAQFSIGFIVVQHFLFLGLPWQLRRIGSKSLREAGRLWVDHRQQMLMIMSAAALGVLFLFSEQVLSLFGERFTQAGFILKALLVIRFIDLLWGPQHEVLVSNGLIRADALANLLAVLVWVTAFGMFVVLMPAQYAAVLSALAGSLTAQGYRAMIIHRSVLHCPRLLPA